MADIKVRLGSENSVKVISSVAGDTTLASLRDIDFSGGLSNLMYLQYDSTVSRWKGTLSINSNLVNINQGTITSDIPFFNATSSWNNPRVSFTGFKVNVTNTSSLETSKLVDYQIGGITRFSISSSGISSFTNQVYFGSSLFLSIPNSGITTRGIPYFSSVGQILSTNSPEVGYLDTTNYILTTDSSHVPVWSNALDGGEY